MFLAHVVRREGEVLKENRGDDSGVQESQKLVLHGIGSGRVLADDEDGVVAGNGANHFGPLFIVQRDGDGTGVARRGLEDNLILREAYILQEFAGESCEQEVGSIAAEVPVTFAGLDKAKLPHIAREGDLLGVNADFFQRARQLFLSENALAANYFEDLTVAKALGHAMFAIRTRAVISAD